MQPRRAGGSRWAAAVVASVVGLVTAGRGHAADDPTRWIRDGFETPRPVWSQEQTDATITLEAHDRTPRAAHEGRTSEHFRFTAGLGSAFFFSYPLPRGVPASDDLKASLYVRASRAGVQVFARVVLPADIDPDTKQPSFVLVPGTVYENADRWQRLELLELGTSVERQARVLRATTRRQVSLEGAYVDRLVVNLFAGTGQTEVFLDELAVGPVSPAAVSAHAAALEGRQAAAEAGGALAELRPPDPAPSAVGPAGAGGARVRLDRNRFKRRAEDGLYHDWIFTGVYAPGADVGSLRNVAFDVWIDDLDADPKRWQEAVSRGFLLMPTFPRGADGALPDAAAAAAAAAAFPFRESVAAWFLGDRLGRAADPRARDEELDRARALVEKVRGLPAGVSRYASGLVDDEFTRFAKVPRNLDLIGVRPAAWGGSMGLMDTFAFLRQRRDLTALSNASALYWAMLPATPPAALSTAVWGQDVPPPGGQPQVQPEQLRLMTYAALSAGYRGIAFRGDADLTRGPGRMLLLEMALLNAEIDLFESILANGADPLPVYNAFPPDPSSLPQPGGRVNQRVQQKKEQAAFPTVKGAAVGTRDRKGLLLLVADYEGAGQFQPAQMARDEISMTVIVPEGAQAFEVSPGHVRVLDRERGVGGTRITIPEFDTTSLVLVTTDVAMAERVQAAVNSIRPRAAALAIEQAELKLAWVTEVNGRLAADGHYLVEDRERRKRQANGGGVPTDQADLLAKAAENIKAARENLEREDFSGAWSEARRASRPLRVLMRGLWENAVVAMTKANMHPEDLANEELLQTGRAKRKGPNLIVPPVASPSLSSFNLLPQHYLWVDWMKTAYFGDNLVPTGDFEDPAGLEKAGWADESYRFEGVKSSVTVVGKEGSRHVKMKVEPAEGKRIDDLPPFLDFPAAAVRSPAVKVRAGQFVRISLTARRSVATAAGAGGLVVRDSLGGEPLQYVSTGPIPAPTRVVLYRRAAADGELTVTLGLAGYGEATFDDLKVERVEERPSPAAAAADVARLPRPRRPEASPPGPEPRAAAAPPGPRGRASR